MIGFLFSRIGGYLAAFGAVIAALSLVLLKAFNAGKRAEREEQKSAQIDAVKERKAIDETIDRMSDSDVRKRLRDRWGR